MRGALRHQSSEFFISMNSANSLVDFVAKFRSFSITRRASANKVVCFYCKSKLYFSLQLCIKYS